MEAEDFIRPPEAPVFQPTLEEFEDPIAYISKIRPVVLNTGICKIKPPPGWRPPFAVNIETFRFTPRIQPLNELDAKTRVKLNFLDALFKFWDMQGMTFKIPNVLRTPLDLHKLYKVVTKHGGFEEVCRCRKWTTITREMNYDNHTVAGSLRVNYEKFLYPYEIFLVSNGQLKLDVKPQGLFNKEPLPPSEGIESEETNMMENHTPDGKLRRSRRKRMEDPDYVFDLTEDNPEFKKLAFVAPGPKNAFALLKRSTRRCIQRKDEDMMDISGQTYVATPPPGIKQEEIEPDIEELEERLKPMICEECKTEYCEEELLSCKGCKRFHHTFCLVPPLPSAPSGIWYCSLCIAKECCQPVEAFGFEQAKTDYSLRTFGQMANQFKTNYFNTQPTTVPFATVEKEFWRLVRSIDDEVTVEYGADLHSSIHGSGFPMYDPSSDSVTVPGAEAYAKSGWNLNNLPNLKGSVLRHIDVNISGMKVPWLYVGMCFSCFCWHTEDHWIYSINYLHWGEPKTWYGVPSAYADALEETMKEQAPELFDNQPDLMHHLATTMSPSLLMKNGIPVVRTDQCAGEFVVTFPRAYHAGFNQGFNFAEAVNFSVADWLPVGRQSVHHYRLTQKHPVFCHDELVCKMIAQPDELDLSLLLVTTEDASTMLSDEEELRRNIKQAGILAEERVIFELISDDERQCCVCKTCCFLSGVQCTCNKRRLSCPHHFKEMCSCQISNKCLKYRYSIDELQNLISLAQKKANLFCAWSDQVDQLLDGFHLPKPDLKFMKDLRDDSETKGFTSSDQYQELNATITEAERVLELVCNIGQNNNDEQVTVEKLQRLLVDVESLPCVIPPVKALQSRLDDILIYQQDVSSALSTLPNLTTSGEGIKLLKDLLERGESLNVDISQITELRNAINQIVWVRESEDLLSNGHDLHFDTLRNMYKKGSTLPHSQAVDNVLQRVKTLISLSQEWEQKIKSALKEKPPHPIVYYESMLSKSHDIPVIIPLVETVTETIQLAKQWTAQAQHVQVTDKDPHYDTLKELLSSSRPLPVRLDHLPQIESRYSAAKAWVDRAGRTFLKKNSPCSLLEVLLPRTSVTCCLTHPSKGKKKQDNEYSIIPTPLTSLKGDRLKEMEYIHEMERAEKTHIQSLRKTNIDKQQDGDSKSGSSPVVYCLCRKPESGYMLQCEVCNEWYHAHCLHIPKSKLSQESDVSKDMRFICGACLRTRRPRLDAIVSLLISLQKVPVAISEGTALHCLAERAIAWQKRARELISLKRGIIDDARGQQLRLIDLRKKILKWKEEAISEPSVVKTENDIQAQLASQADSVLRHYNNQLSKEKSSYVGLSELQRKRVEEVLLDGDLLEVTTDETTQLWQLLQTDSECLSYFTLSEEEALKCELPKISQRKPTVVYDELDDEATPPVITDSVNAKKRKRGDAVTKAPLTETSSPVTKRKKTMKQNEKKKRSSGPTRTKVSPTSTGSSPSKSSRPKTTSPSHVLGCTEEIIDEDEDEEDDEQEERMEDTVCSASQCIRPMSSELSWVQCDQCQLWYHLLCVGLTIESVEEIDVYHCFSCKQKTLLDKETANNNSLATRNA